MSGRGENILLWVVSYIPTQFIPINYNISVKIDFIYMLNNPMYNRYLLMLWHLNVIKFLMFVV